MKLVDIVLPVYNEQEGIAAFNEALLNLLQSLASEYRFRIIYVLDRSADNTFPILKSLAAVHNDITVLHLSRRFGHQMSLVAGIDYSRGDAVIMMDCDQQHPPAVIPALLEKFEEGHDVVHTVRRYDPQTPLLKRWMSRLFYRLQNMLSPVELRDGAADFRLISRKVAAVFQASIREHNQFLRGLFQWIGFKSTTVEFVSPPRAAGNTKYHLGRLLTFAVSGILSFSKVPLRLATLAGVAITCLSFIYCARQVIAYFVEGYLPRGYTSLIVVVLLLGGLQLTVMGIMGEYLGSIFEEVKHRPLYVVDEVVTSDEAHEQQRAATRCSCKTAE